MVVIHTPDLAFGLARNGERTWEPALDLPSSFVKGSTGTGDAFFAGMLVAIHEGWDMAKGFTAAASCLRHPTTATGGVGNADETSGSWIGDTPRKRFPDDAHLDV
jgi:sugar/nucleoside kinase (ribokinase family)